MNWRLVLNSGDVLSNFFTYSAGWKFATSGTTKGWCFDFFEVDIGGECITVWLQKFWMAFECILGNVGVVLVRKQLDKNGVLTQESNAKVFYFRLWFYRFLEFLQEVQDFSFSNSTVLSPIFLASFTNFSGPFLSGQWCSIYRQRFCSWGSQVAPTTYARCWFNLEVSLNKWGSMHQVGWLTVPKLDLSAWIKEK